MDPSADGDLGTCLSRDEGLGVLPAAASAQDEQVRERRRVKELLRYFQPFQVEARSESNGGGRPRIATDASLTALAQLAALKLQCQRCFISLIDNTKQYIVAEATQTISLTDEDLYDDDDDKLSFGQTVLDFKTGVCPGTIACFTSSDDSLNVMSTYIKASRSYYVMNDMSMLEGYKGRTYVKGWPHMKFYAEVPIHSPSGTCIGTLCVVDNKARSGLDLRGIRILGEIAGAVMDHLELCVSRIQQSRAERMLHGLGQFVDGHISTQETATETQNSRHSAQGKSQLSVDQRSTAEVLSTLENLQLARHGDSEDGRQLMDPRGVEYTNGSHVSQREEDASHTRGSQDVSTPDAARRGPESASDLYKTSHHQYSSTEDMMTSSARNISKSPQGSHSKSSSDDDRNQIDPLALSPNGLEAILFRAANFICEDIGLDGVVFFDPRSSNSHRSTDRAEVSNGITRSTMATNDTQIRHPIENPPYTHQTVAKVAAHATKTTSDRFNSIQMPVETLQILLQKFPRGGLVNFDSEGIVGAEVLTSIIGGLEPTDVHGSSRQSDQESFVIDIIDLPDAELRRIFSEVTSLMFYPFWDTGHDKCVAYCMAWTSEPARVFRRQECTYIASFSNSVSAELSRTELVTADRAKSRFMSSISHELRTPLHGIMASMEILRDLTSDVSFHDLFSTIESCSSTLLETLDNVLAFSQSRKETTKEDTELATELIPGTADSPVRAADLEILSEEVTSICMTGAQFHRIVDSSYAYSKSEPEGHGDKNSENVDEVMVICDVGPGEWVFETNGAVWRRILLNLVSNALKYTSNGFIIVALRQQLPPLERDSKPIILAARDLSATDWPTESKSDQDRAREIVVSLSVKDSGQGMSKDYLEHSLFKPFHQENSLAPGTGLGLSIVKRLVESIGGNITVVSEQGLGTEVIVEIPLRPCECSFEKPSVPLPSLLRMNLGFVGLGQMFEETSAGMPKPQSEALLALRSTISNYAEASHLSTVPVDLVNSAAADILIVQDSQYRPLDQVDVLALKKPVIVLCMQPMQEHEHIPNKPMNVVLLSNPFGLRKFQQAIKSCLQIRSNLLDGSITGTLLNDKYDLLKTENIVPARSAPKQTTNGVENNPVRKLDSVGSSLLLVEDNPINLKILVTSISRMGRPYLTATNGVEAVEAYKACPGQISLVFMDIQMPTMNGIDASRAIRSYEKQTALPRSIIVALTALDSAEAEEAAVDSGVDLFFTKPVSMEKLKEIVTRYHS